MEFLYILGSWREDMLAHVTIYQWYLYQRTTYLKGELTDTPIGERT